MSGDLTEDELRRVRHDLRTPLTIVAGFAEMLASDRAMTVEARREYAERIMLAAKELRAMLDELLGS